MRFRSSARILFMVGLLVGSLALFGCPKRPEVGQAPPSAPGPGAVMVAPAAPSPTTAPPEVRVEPPAAQAVVPEAPKAPEKPAADKPAADKPAADAPATGG